jgi:ribosome-binding protein aMBF1 (putative translation factor)
MSKKFSSLRNSMSEQAQAETAEQIEATLAQMPLHELRRARGLSQKMLAETLRVQQPAIAKLEQRTDMYISTLRSHIEAMGGELEITASFPEGAVRISNFSQLETAP